MHVEIVTLAGTQQLLTGLTGQNQSEAGSIEKFFDGLLRCSYNHMLAQRITVTCYMP